MAPKTYHPKSSDWAKMGLRFGLQFETCVLDPCSSIPNIIIATVKKYDYPDLGPVCMTHILAPTLSSQSLSYDQLAPRFWTCMCDPYKRVSMVFKN